MKNSKQKLIFIFQICCMISFFIIVILHYDKMLLFCKKIITIISPFLYGVLFAYLLEPLATKIEQKWKHRYFAIFITEVIFLILISSIIFTIIPQSIKSVSAIIEHFQNREYLLELTNKIPILEQVFGKEFEKINTYIQLITENMIDPNKTNIITYITKSVTTVTLIIFHIVIGIIISVLMLSNKEKLLIGCKKILYVCFPKKIVLMILDELSIANKIFHGFFYGKMMDSFIVFILCLIFLSILKMPYIILVSVIIGITNMIPVAGPFIGAIPGTIIIFSESPIKSLIFIIFIIILQQIDGHIIGPKCIANSTGLDTFWVLFSIIFFGELWGIVGLVIGVPLFAVIFDICSKLINENLEKKGFMTKNNNILEEDKE